MGKHKYTWNEVKSIIEKYLQENGVDGNINLEIIDLDFPLDREITVNISKYGLSIDDWTGEFIEDEAGDDIHDKDGYRLDDNESNNPQPS